MSLFYSVFKFAQLIIRHPPYHLLSRCCKQWWSRQVVVKLDAKRPWEIERGRLDLHKVVLLSGYSFFILTGYSKFWLSGYFSFAVTNLSPQNLFSLLSKFSFSLQRFYCRFKEVNFYISFYVFVFPGIRFFLLSNVSSVFPSPSMSDPD